jgi:glycosyltransferase involved in cell wall biosynthesis
MITSTYPRYKEDTVPAFVHELAKKIVDLGMEVHVVSPHHAVATCDEKLERVFVHRFKYMPSKLEILAGGAGMPQKLQDSLTAKMQLLPYMVSSFSTALKVSIKNNVDIIHAHWFFPSGLIGVFVKKLIHRPLVLTGYGVEFFLVKRKYRWLSFLMRWIASNADECVFISNAVREAAGNIGVRRSTVIPYGVDTEKFTSMHLERWKVNTLKKKYKICGEKIILAVGRLVERKGFHFLIEGMPSILKSVPNAVLVIVGNGPEKRVHINQAHKLGLDDKVKLISDVPQSDLLLLYNICDVFVLPSIVDKEGDQEGFGIVLCEAMACGKPVVSTRTGGIPDIVKDGKNGILVEQKSVKELSRAVLDVLGNQKLAEKLGNRGRISVKRKFSFGCIAKAYISIYKALLKQETKRRARAIGRVGNDAQNTKESWWHSR